MSGVNVEENGHGRLVPLRTRAEVQTGLTLIDAYVVEVPQKQANYIVKQMDNFVPQQDALNLQHLRRVARPESLPIRLRKDCDSGFPGMVNIAAGPACCISNSFLYLRESDEGEARPRQPAEPAKKQQTLYVLVCPATTITLDELSNALLSMAHFWEGICRQRYQKIPVPADPPTSDEEAKKWSLHYWPAIYRKHNPKGPHPSIISRAEDELKHFAGKWMRLAHQAGIQASSAALGESVGAVIIDAHAPSGPVAVVVAGDARWKGNCADSKMNQGNVMGHAAMRAIGLVARLRKSVQSREEILSVESNPFADIPLTQFEREAISGSILQPGGYLCTDLDIVLTHEPCVMCSMAILHSRFGRVIFGERMQHTGGLVAETGNNNEPGLGYGLFWRPDLNWKLLAWQWLDNASHSSLSSNSLWSGVHA